MTIFDTEYLLMGSPTESSLELFEPSKTNCDLSTNMVAWTGYRRKGWSNFEEQFMWAKKSLSMVQTDLVYVPKTHIDEFVKTMEHL